MLRIAVVAGLLAAPPAAADDHPYALGAELGFRLTLLGGDDILPRLALSGARRWDDRWQTGVRLAYELGSGMPGDVSIAEVSGEVGMWLHLSPRLDLLLGWRAGYASLSLGDIGVRALVIENATELSYHWRPRLEIRFAPAVVTGYRSGLWQVTFGSEVGLAWLL